MCLYYLWINYYNIHLFNFIIFTIILFDSFSFFIGKFFGKNLIFKTISPNKTFEGYLGGILLTNLSYQFYSLIVYGFIFNIIETFLLNLIIFSAAMGDLIESLFKRKNNLKDSSNFLPGHGGFFDRFDSFLFSIIALFVYYIFY